MLFTVRQRKIIELLWMVRDFITVKDIADEISFSEKTVRSELNIIGHEIHHHNIGKLVAKTNKGFYLDVDRAAFDKISATFIDHHIDNRIQSRLSRVLVMLLTLPKVSLQELAEGAFLDKSGLKKYLIEAEQYLARFEIRLEKCETYYSLEGGEAALRQVYWHLFLELKGRLKRDAAALGDNHERCHVSLDDSDYLAIKVLFKKELVYIDSVIQTLDKIENNYLVHYTYDAFIWLVVNLLLVIGRQGRTRDPATLLPRAYLENSDACPEQEMAMSICQQLPIAVKGRCATLERHYIAACLLSCEFNEIKEKSLREQVISTPPAIMAVTQRFILSLSNIVSGELVRDKSLLLRLILLIRPMIFRIKFDMNHLETESAQLLVRQVKLSYLDLFLEVEYFIRLYEQQYATPFSDNEIGFITLCIKNAQSLSMKKIRVAIVCNYGIGISQFVAQKIMRAITQVEIVDILSVRELHRLDNNFCDLVVTTVPVNLPKATTVQVNDVLLPYDLSVIKDAVKKMQKSKMLESVMSHGNGTLQRFQSYILPEMTFAIDDSVDKETVLTTLCHAAVRQGLIDPGYLQSLLAREKISSTEIAPGVVLTHGDPALVKRNFISLTRLAAPACWREGRACDVIVLVAFKKAADGKIDSSIAGFYSMLARLVDNECAMKSLRQCKTPGELYRYFISLH
ncbi:PTS modulated transcriptional antiterminator [Sodalis praecaptivus]|uniref:PTS modulated transcriptional antiterminator n=1 Tax=Sodalis praecaptivus TaxID=1239307 RepID=W0HMW3_9GAMM|nr:PTS sugar transporter subunit IIA [Sodalis praecaptivus]AHF75164.1 PTS modulated transcriptional antiterminator [Sodalis praecaptivus]